MDLDRKKKIAIIASIIGGSVIILIICVWVLIAAITGGNNKRRTPINTLEETETPTADVTPSATPTEPTYNFPSEIVDNTPTPSNTPTTFPTATPVSKVPDFSTVITTRQLSYNSAKKTTEVEINFQIDEPGKVNIIAVDSSKNFNPTSQQVKEHLITGEMLSHQNARIVETVNKNDKNKSSFVITVGFNKVDIFIVLESSAGAISNTPTKISFTPSVAALTGSEALETDGNNIEIKNIKLTQDGYVHVLVIKEKSNLLNDFDKLVAAAKGEDNNDVLLKIREKISSNSEKIRFEIPENVKNEKCKLVLLTESIDNSNDKYGPFDKNYKTLNLKLD